MKKGIFTVLTNDKLTDSVYKMTLSGDTSAIERPGQFVNIELEGLYLRRPISVCDYEDGKLTIIYKVVGKGTEQMSGYDAGVKLDILTGLGNGYFTEFSGDKPLLIGGGVGIPPLYNLCKTLIKEGKTDLAIVPVSVAVNLFRETQGGIRILAVNNLVTQYVITKGEEVNELADLKGKTVYSLGKGTASEFIVNEILDKNGIDPEKDITVEYKDTPDEIKAAFEKENGGICILHEPQATEFLVADTKSKRVIRLSEEWKKAEGFDLVQNVVIARKDYIDKNPEYIEKFLGHNELSLNFLSANADGVSPSFLVNNGYYSDATVAASIIAAGNFAFITGDEMKTSVNGVLDFLSRTDPESISEIPDGELFYIK